MFARVEHVTARALAARPPKIPSTWQAKPAGCYRTFIGSIQLHRNSFNVHSGCEWGGMIY